MQLPRHIRGFKLQLDETTIDLDSIAELILVVGAALAGYFARRYQRNKSDTTKDKLALEQRRRHELEQAYNHLENDYRELQGMLRHADLEIRKMAEQLHNIEGGC